MWGQVLVCKPCDLDYRIIPTRVGTSFGEYIAGLDKKGSSPRVWGQGRCDIIEVADKRIIPTRVGTRIAGKEVCVCEKDHPHACGDKFFNSGQLGFILGSSPRVWGQVRICGGQSTWSGIIPTRVGTSCVYDAFSIWSEDHPHACGDKISLR